MTRRRCRLSIYKQNKLLEMFVAGGRAFRCQPPFGDIVYQKIREMIAYELKDESPFDGEVEVDESYFGG